MEQGAKEMKYNIENRIKDTAIVNLTDFENAIDLYEDGEIEKALELMFGITRFSSLTAL